MLGLAGVVADGQIGIRPDVMVRPDRIAWMLAHDAAVPDGMYVLHSCDNPPCVNPAHLRLGTQQDNANDRVQRNRSAIGARNGKARLTADQVREIRRRRASGESRTSVARAFDINPGTVWYIDQRVTWTHVR
jgi:hypothetical protein